MSDEFIAKSVLISHTVKENLKKSFSGLSSEILEELQHQVEMSYLTGVRDTYLYIVANTTSIDNSPV